MDRHEPSGAPARPRITIFAGPSATVTNNAPLVTGRRARALHGLPGADDPRVDALRPQRLAAPVTVYVEQFSAHPLEADAAELYAPPDGWVRPDGTFHRGPAGPGDVPAYEVELRPGDGLYPLPYHGRQADGSAWEAETAGPMAPIDRSRQTFFPDPSRLVEEIDRLGVGPDGRAGVLSTLADFEFVRVAPSGGWRHGEPRTGRPEVPGEDFFFYSPFHLRHDAPLEVLATITNRVAASVAEPGHDGGIWLEASTSIEETTYWLGLLVETDRPIVGVCSPDSPHGVIGNTGDRNLVDAVSYIRSRAWADESGRDRVGPVLIAGGLVIAARDAAKTDARPGGFGGNHGAGVVGNVARLGFVQLGYLPDRRSGRRSEVRLSALPDRIEVAVREGEPGVGPIVRRTVATQDADGLLGTAMPDVAIVKAGRFPGAEAPSVRDRLERILAAGRPGGIVAEGTVPYAGVDVGVDRVLRAAVLSGIPVVKVGRGAPDGFTTPDVVGLAIAGGDLAAVKARLLLAAALLRFGALPIAADPSVPTPDELAATRAALARYQAVFDTH